MKNIASATLLAAAFAATQLFAASAFAQDKTRAEVKAEAASANKAGTVVKEASPAPMAQSTKARTQVKGERDAARGMAKVERSYGDAGVAEAPKSTKTRAEVKKERDAAKPKNDAAKAKDYSPAK